MTGILLATLIAAVGLFGLATTATAVHDSVDWSRYWPPPVDSRHQLFPTLLTDQRGGLYFFQFDVNPSGNTNVSVTKYATRGPSGNPEWQFSSVVNPTKPDVVFIGNPYFFGAPPSAAVDHNAALYSVWADSSHDVYVSKSSDGGQSWGAAFRVDSTNPDYDDYDPDIVAVPNGDLYAVWFQIWSPGNLRSLAVARSTDGGQTWSGRTNITTGAIYHTHDLSADSLGRLHLVYTSFGPSFQANYTRSDDGTTWSGSVRLDGGLDGLYPAIVTDSSDRVHVLWYDGRQSPGGTNTYWYRRSDDRGATWTMEMPVSQGRFPTGGEGVPTLAVHGDTVIAGWYVVSGFVTLGYAVSADGGDLWDPEEAAEFGISANRAVHGADENGTFYAGFYYFNGFSGNFDVGYSIWDGPPSAPSLTEIARATGSLTVSWTGSPEGDVAGYRLWRSTDGVTYELAGAFDSTTRSFADSGLADGVYWYRVTSFDSRGTSSHDSEPKSASVGLSLSEEIANLQDQLAALEDQNSAEAAALRERIDDLERQLNAIQAEKATQAQSLLNTVLLVIVILLLVFMFLQSRRRSMMAPRMPLPPTAPTAPITPPWQPPPSPPTPPEPSKPPETGFPEEEL